MFFNAGIVTCVGELTSRKPVSRKGPWSRPLREHPGKRNHLLGEVEP